MLQEFNSTSKQVIAESDAYTMAKLMEGVIKFGTARTLNRFTIPVEKAGKTGTTNNNADGWFIGYTPELLAGTWVGCDDPFIRIYSGTSGGNEMALPKWGYFMKKVYADKALPYGSILKFEEPANLANNPVYADENFANLATKGDSSQYEDQGNGNAGDFIDAPLTETSNTGVPIESELPKKQKDTVIKNKSITPAPVIPLKTPDKKDIKPATTPALKPVDKNQKPIKNDKPKTANDYR